MHRHHLAHVLAACLCAAAAHDTQAGLSLDLAVLRDRRQDQGGPASSLLPLLPQPGLTVAVEGGGPETPPLIADELNGRGGLRVQSRTDVHGTCQWQGGLAWRGRRATILSLEGSSASCEVGEDPGLGEFYASAQRRHWGPGWAGSLILDGAAPAVPAVGWRRPVALANESPWLAWIGPWSADMFIGRLQGHRQPARPMLMGIRLQFAPGDRVEIGLSRCAQWGGRGRDESSSSFFNALLGNDNVGFDGITAQNEPGNQLAGLDLRLIVDPVSQVSVYGQMIGEDEAGHLPSRNMVLFGIDAQAPLASGSLRFFAEFSDTLAGRISHDPRPTAAYRHSAFRQGYTQEGFVLGHPLGGDAKAVSAGWLYRNGPLQAMLVTAAGRADPTAQFFAPGRILGVNAAVQWQAEAATQVGATVAWWSDRTQRRTALQLWWRALAW